MANRIQKDRDSKKIRLGNGFEALEPRLVLTGFLLPYENCFMTFDDGSEGGISGQAIEEHPTPPTEADGNTYSTARNLGHLSGVKKIHDFVGRGDRKDIYQFQLGHETDVRIKLHNLEADAELRLLDANRELIRWSLRSGTTDEFIQADLESGMYFVRVDAFDGKNSTEYDLRVTAVDSREDTGGDSPAEATPVGTLDQENDIRISGWVGNGDRWDYYKFVAEQFMNLRGVLNRLSANANLHLFDNDHNLLASSTNPGKNVDRIVVDVSPGVYIFGVETFSGSTNYQLVATAEPKEQSGRLADVEYYGTTARDRDLNAIYAPEAWNAGITGDDVVVAVVDSGVDFNHRDLATQMWTNPDEIAGDGIDNDNNGFVDDVRGWDFASDDNTPNDENGHGTHVAGIIASARNRYGATGVAYDAKIMPIRVLDRGGDGSFGDLARGIYYAVDNGADVINLSIGGEYNYSVRAAIAYANANGVFVSTASGNGGLEMPLYPARHSAAISNTLSVGAHNRSDARAWFSNHVGSSGAVQVDAPGVNVYSTMPNNRYGRYSGTSSAAPFVSGLAALVLSVNKSYSPNLVRHFITEGAIRDIADSDSIGGIDAARTLYLAQQYGGNDGGGGFPGGDDGSGPGGGDSGGEPGGLRIQKQNWIDWSRLAEVDHSGQNQWRPVVESALNTIWDNEKWLEGISRSLASETTGSSLSLEVETPGSLEQGLGNDRETSHGPSPFEEPADRFFASLSEQEASTAGSDLFPRLSLRDGLESLGEV
ncbi:MAG: S8 family peptidase [Planctomycetota bacterium]|nr:S8 family peptidase [Planctomycetota bacterium]